MVKNEYRVTWKVYMSWLWENKRKPARLGFTVFWILFGLVAAGMAVASRFAVYLVITFLCLYRVFMRDILYAKRQYRAMVNSYGQRDWLRVISFDEMQVSLVEGNLSVHYKYSDLSKIREKGNKVWLILRDEKVLRLYKDCFVEGDWEKCRTLIEGKCGPLQ